MPKPLKIWTSQESPALSYFILLYLVNRCKRLKWNILPSTAGLFYNLRKRSHMSYSWGPATDPIVPLHTQCAWKTLNLIFTSILDFIFFHPSLL